MADWSKITSRGSVEDRRGAGLALGGGAGVIGLAIYLISTFLGGSSPELQDVLSQLQQTQGVQTQANQGEFAGPDDYEKFASAVLGSANDSWRQIFAQNNREYREPRLVLFRSVTQSGCGLASSEVGPHYCPADQTIYLDETFFDELRTKYKAQGGDVAEAYVIAHEVGHHVQNVLGVMDDVAARGRDNDLSVRLELQADCFAGVWAHSVSSVGVIAPGEINEAVDAAAAVGDDRIQKAVTGQVNPETWTHGSSAQRVDWFNRGFTSGVASQCNTFK